MIHQYQNNGYNIVLDVNSGAIHVVDELMYEVIGLYEDHSSEEIKAQLIQVHTAQLNVEKAREHLTQLMQERKMHERLKEKAFEQFLQEEKQRESKEIDELTSYTYGQRIAQNKEKDQVV